MEFAYYLHIVAYLLLESIQTFFARKFVGGEFPGELL